MNHHPEFCSGEKECTCEGEVLVLLGSPVRDWDAEGFDITRVPLAAEARALELGFGCGFYFGKEMRRVEARGVAD